MGERQCRRACDPCCAPHWRARLRRRWRAPHRRLATVAVNAGYGVRFMDTNEFYPHQQISVIFYSEKFAKERTDVAQKFMRAWLRGVRSYNDALKEGKIAGPGADEVVATMARSFNMNPGFVRQMHSQAVDVTGPVNAG